MKPYIMVNVTCTFFDMESSEESIITLPMDENIARTLVNAEQNADWAKCYVGINSILNWMAHLKGCEAVSLREIRYAEQEVTPE